MTLLHVRLLLVALSFVAAAWPQTIRRVAGTGTSGFSGDGGTALSAQFDNPRSVAVDGLGNLYLADHVNDRIRKIAANGQVTTIAGTGDIFKDAPDGANGTQIFLWRPSSVLAAPNGEVYVADTLRDVVRKIALDGTMHIVAGTSNALSNNNGSGGPAKQAKLKWPRGLALDSAGNLFIADSLNNVVRKVTPEGTIFNVAGVFGQEGYDGDNKPAVSAKITGPYDVAVDPAGNLYIAEGPSHRIRKVDTGGTITTYVGTGQPGSTGNGTPANTAQITWSEYIATDRGGNLYLTESTKVRKVTPDGKIYTIAGTGALGNSGDGGNALSATFRGITDVLPIPNGDLYVVDGGNATLRKIEYNCSYSVTPETSTFDAAPGTGTVTVTAAPGCTWGPFSDSASWLTVTNTNTATGVVTFSVAENFGYERTGYIYVAGSQLKVVQRGTRQFFTDVTTDLFNFDHINLLQERGIPSGTATNPNRFFPNDIMTRSQMAVFILRAIYGNDNFPFRTIPYFTDVPSTHPQFRWIQKLRELGITSGCTATTYCPNDGVTRGQMAKFLVGMRYGTEHSYLPPPIPYFNDVTYQHLFYSWIQELRQIGITSGTQSSPPLYSPDTLVTRGQMAVFILRNMLPQYLPAGTPYLSDVTVTGAEPSLTLLITGQNTHFDATTTVYAGPDITVTSIQRVSAQHLIVNVTVGAGAARGPRPVVVRTGTEDASKLVGLTL